jgi:hypothetical protein
MYGNGNGYGQGYNNQSINTGQNLNYNQNSMQGTAAQNNQYSTQYVQQNSSQLQQPYNTDFESSSRITHPSEKIEVPEHILTIDSRQRDYVKYPNPALYTIEIGDKFNNVDTIELKNSVVPRTTYNVHNTNKYIDFSVGDSVTSIFYKGPKTFYSSPPAVTLNGPYNPGTQATAVAVLNSSGNISSINVIVPGSGYVRSLPPFLMVNGLTVDAVVNVGTLYTAVLRNGQYTIGGNPVSGSPDLLVGSGLIKEIQDAMNYAVNGGPYISGSTAPFQVRLVSQYPLLNPIAGSPESETTNACKFNRIQITNTLTGGDANWELMFGTGPNKGLSANTVLGFTNTNVFKSTNTPDVVISGDTVTTAGGSLRAVTDYDLQDDPKYIILTIEGAFKDTNNQFYRQVSENASLNKTFASIVFDANTPNIIIDTSGTTSDDGYLDGPVTKGPFWLPSGTLRAIRGFDSDQKKLRLYAAQGKLQYLTIKWTQYVPNGTPEQLYDFLDKNHMLIFSIKGADNQSGKKW